MTIVFNRIKKEIRQHFLDYLILVTSGVFFLLFLKIFQGDRFLSFITLLVFASSYIIWGLYHHSLRKTLHLKNLIEYIFIGFTVVFLLMFFGRI